MRLGKFDVVVVGAGPAGSLAALTLASGGADVAIVDKATFPRDKACGDLLGPRAVDLLDGLGIRVPGALPVGDMLVVGPSRRSVRLRCTGGLSYPGYALASKRVDLDGAIRDAAVKAGAVPLEGQVVSGGARGRSNDGRDRGGLDDRFGRGDRCRRRDEPRRGVIRTGRPQEGAMGIRRPHLPRGGGRAADDRALGTIAHGRRSPVTDGSSPLLGAGPTPASASGRCPKGRARTRSSCSIRSSSTLPASVCSTATSTGPRGARPGACSGVGSRWAWSARFPLGIPHCS